LDLEDYPEAISQLNEILKSDSSNNDLNRAMGYSYFETGQYDKSLYYMKKFLNRSKPEKIRATDYVYYGRSLSKNKMDSLAAITLLQGYSMDTSKPELLSEAAMSYNRMKKYDKAVELYKMKIGLKQATPIDYYNLGKDYYNLQDWGKVDTTLAIVNSLQVDFIPGYLWRARALANLDPDTKAGLAKPVFEAMVAKAAPDSAKYSKELEEAYYYLSYYYLVQYNVTKNNENGQKSLEFCQKILAIDPTNDKAKEIIKVLGPKIKH
jgi:tetratricopeptide (TPR) repeat protein